MKHWQYFLLTISLSSLVACGGGSSSTGGNTPAVSNLSKTTIIYSNTPRINEELKISIEDNTETVTTGYTWKVESAPAPSNLQLTPSSDSKSVLLTAGIAGKYKIIATLASGEVLETQFIIKEDFPFNPTKLGGYDNTQELSKQNGIVSNQVWVYSETLNQSAIESIVSNYQGFTIIGFDETRGLLVEFDDTQTQSQLNINILKTVLGIDTVDPRVFEGRNYIRLAHKVANDGSAFNDGGDNWHLEHIGIEKAWDVTTGNNDFYIGIVDGADSFHTQHEDLRGRFKEATKAVTDSPRISHGTGVAGAIAAITNNNKGISGINWSNQLIASKGGFFELSLFVARDDIFLTNMSLGLVPEHITDRFDPNSPESVEETQSFSVAQTSDFRKLATQFSNKLFVYSAGNGIGNGAGNDASNNEIFGIDGRYADPALHYLEKENEFVLTKKSNVLFVAAHYIDNRLTYYSNYGESVDIAAPTGFKSTKNDSNPLESFQSLDSYYTSSEYGAIRSIGDRDETDNAFSGTSASAPVVTGVASLIKAADEELSASNIKSILINSATASISERYPNPFDISEFETLANPIPILNAASALSMTKEIKDGREAKGTHVYPDPFKPTIEVSISSTSDKLKTKSYNFVANIKKEGIYEEMSSGNVTGSNPIVIENFPSDISHFKFEGDNAQFTHEASDITVKTDYVYELYVQKFVATTTNKDTQAIIPNIALKITAEDASFSIASGSTNTDGNVPLFLAPGKYTINAKASGYEDLSKVIFVKLVDSNLVFHLEMKATSSNPNPPSTAVGILKPITPLTTSESEVIPSNGTLPSFSVLEETGTDGDIDQELFLKEGVSSIQAVDIQRDLGISVICEDGIQKPVTLNEANYSTSTISETFYDNGQVAASCSSSYAPILPITLTNANISDVLEDWGGEPVSSDCPIDTNVTPPPAFSINTLCTSVSLRNYLITDSNGKEHKVSIKLTSDVDE